MSELGYMIPLQPVHLKLIPKNSLFKEWVRDASICKLINDGLTLGSIKLFSGEAKDHVEEMNGVLGLQRSIPRKWRGIHKKCFT